MKPENVLLKDAVHWESLKIVDFGTAVSANRTKTLKQMIGTPYYMAPEVCDGNYTSKCDVWSIGVIAFMLLSGKAPFYGDSNERIFAMARRGPKYKESDWSHVSKEAQGFISTLLTVNGSDRPSCA